MFVSRRDSCQEAHLEKTYQRDYAPALNRAPEVARHRMNRVTGSVIHEPLPKGHGTVAAKLCNLSLACFPIQLIGKVDGRSSTEQAELVAKDGSRRLQSAGVPAEALQFRSRLRPRGG